MNRKSLMSSGLDNESTRNKLKELALYDSETNETVVLCQDLVQVKMRNFSPILTRQKLSLSVCSFIQSFEFIW